MHARTLLEVIAGGHACGPTDDDTATAGAAGCEYWNREVPEGEVIYLLLGGRTASRRGETNVGNGISDERDQITYGKIRREGVHGVEIREHDLNRCGHEQPVGRHV